MGSGLRHLIFGNSHIEVLVQAHTIAQLDSEPAFVSRSVEGVGSWPACTRNMPGKCKGHGFYNRTIYSLYTINDPVSIPGMGLLSITLTAAQRGSQEPGQGGPLKPW